MTEQRLYNFSSGPAVLPESVLKKAQAEFLCLPGVGASVMEISHRSQPFEQIINGAEQNIRKLLSVPDNYTVLFLQGGALLQFGMIPMNLKGNEKDVVAADYIVTGNWSKKAASEAKLLGRTNVIWDGKDTGYKRKPGQTELDINEDAAYVYICSNETIEGVQWQEYPKPQSKSGMNLPLVCDASSDFLSKPVDISKFGLYYACAQKNAGIAGVTIVIIRNSILERSPETGIPSLLHYKKIAEQKSMLNTPPTFAIYMVKLVTDWLLNDIGGLEKIAAINAEKAKLLYEVIDASYGFYKGHADKEFRSVMNIPFRLPNEELDKKFQNEAKLAGLITLGGHRSVGGLRASIYNAMPKAGAEKLRQFMLDFATKNR